MRLVSYDREGERRLGALFDGAVIDLPDAVGHPAFPSTMEALLARHGGTTMDAARAAFEHDDVMDFAIARPRLLPPVLPGVVGRAGTGGVPGVPAAGGLGAVATLSRPKPVVSPPGLLGPGDQVAWPEGARQVQATLQVACVIGTASQPRPAAQAEAAVFGVTTMVRWSVPGPRRSRPFATSLGPWLVTPDEADLTGAPMRTEVDGEPRAEAHVGEGVTAGMVARGSRTRDLRIGDLLGSAIVLTRCVALLDRRDSGAKVTFSIDGLGTLRNSLASDR